MKESYHHADRTIIAELALYGRFYQVPDWLYFRRDHDDRAERACPTMRSRCANMDPRRADRLRHPAVRLYGEYVWAYISGDPARAAVGRGPARVLPLPGTVVRQPRAPGCRRTGRTRSGGPSGHPCRLHRGWPGEIFVSSRPAGQGETYERLTPF